MHLYPVDPEMPVQAKPCRACPFAGENPVLLLPDEQLRILHNLLTFKATHLCHSTGMTKVCRGGRNVQLWLLASSEQIEEPTDECFQKAVLKVLTEADSLSA